MFFAVAGRVGVGRFLHGVEAGVVVDDVGAPGVVEVEDGDWVSRYWTALTNAPAARMRLGRGEGENGQGKGERARGRGQVGQG